MASKKGQNGTMPRRPSALKQFKPSLSPKGNLRDHLNFKRKALFSRIGEVLKKKSTSVPSVTREEPLPDNERLSSQVNMLSRRISDKIYTTETKEMPSETERLPSETGIPFQRMKTSLALTEEISPKAGDLDEEGKTEVTPQQSPSNGERRNFSANSPCATKYFFLLDHGVQLTDTAKELSDEQMNLLWEDIFKPLDFCSILHDRRKQLSSNSDIETNMQNLFSII